MNWIYTSSKFKYNNKPVERRKAICDTVLGELRVYEAVGGRSMMKYFYIGFIKDSDGKKIPSLNIATMPCATLEAGVLFQEIKWKELIDKMINA